VNSTLRLLLQHSGSNAGMLDWVRIHSWQEGTYWECQIGMDLDYSSSYTTPCSLAGEQRTGDLCNGAAQFCALSVSQFLWAGTHNSGTGQKEGTGSCAFKNQDLDIESQLDLGIRFFDIDTIYTRGIAGCHGLETGHGPNAELGLYQCFGLVDDLLFQMRDWLDNHPTELVMLHFGNIELERQTIPILIQTLRNIFPRDRDSVRINTQYKQNGSWPLLGDAVANNERIFVFIRDEIDAITDEDLEFVNEIKVKPGREILRNKTDTEVYITTSYKAKSVGSHCTFVLDTSRKACESEANTETDFLKLSLFSAFGQGGTLGLECLHKMAKKCNKWVETTINNCNYKDFRPSIVVLDYPNYQGESQDGLIQVVDKENYRRAASLEEEL